MNRLKQLGVRKTTVDDVSGAVSVSTHTSAFGTVSDLEASVQLFLTQPGRIFAVGYKGFYATSEEIDRNQIISVKAETGIPTGVRREDRSEAGLPVTGEFPYLKVTLNEIAGNRIKSITEESERLFFAFDYNNLAENNEFLAFPGEGNTYYLLNGRWSTKQPYKALAYILMHDPLSAPYQALWTLDPIADWAEPEELEIDAVGKMQCSVNNLPKDNVSFSFRTLSPNAISDYTFTEVLATMKHRLDLIGSPYAIGTDYIEDRKITVCMPSEKLGYEILRALCASTVSISPSARHDDFIYLGSARNYSSDVIMKEDGTYELQLTPMETFSFDSEELKTAFKQMLAEDDHTVTLTCGSNIVLASAEIDSALEDGILHFNHLPFLNNEAIYENNVFILQLLNDIIRDEALADASAYYRLDEDSILFSEPEGKFGVRKKIAGTIDVIKKINQNFTSVNAGYLDSDENNTVYIIAHQESGPSFCRTAADLVETMYNACRFEESGVDTFLFFLTEEETGSRCRLSVDRLEAEIWYIDKPYGILLSINGDDMQQYVEEWEEIFQTEEFFYERHASVWNLMGQN